MILASQSIDWTTIIVAVIATIPSTLAALLGISIRRQVATPSGDPIGHVVERAHEAGIANNLLLRQMNGETKPSEHEALHEPEAEHLHVPTDEPGG